MNIEKRLQVLEAKRQPKQPDRFDNLTKGEIDLVILSLNAPALLNSAGLKKAQELLANPDGLPGKCSAMSDEQLDEAIKATKVALLDSDWQSDSAFLNLYLVKPGTDHESWQSIRKAELQ
ncbi:MAG: hypothetical protein ABSA82_00350 [Thermacetogeniaceae bacterium]|jgi:hypothetical protein